MRRNQAPLFAMRAANASGANSCVHCTVEAEQTVAVVVCRVQTIAYIKRALICRERLLQVFSSSPCRLKLSDQIPQQRPS